MKILKKILLFLLLTVLFPACKTLPQKNVSISRELLGKPLLNAEQLALSFLKQNPTYDKKRILQFAQFYIIEAKIEGINSDVAFAQMCLETGYLKFGNLVSPEMHNYCGLGSTGPGNPGVSFATEQLGVRAHIQHLHAYATTEKTKLNLTLIDPRYNWVHKTKYAETIFDLAGVWATDLEYGEKINQIICRMENEI